MFSNNLDNPVLKPLSVEEAMMFSENLEHAFLAEVMQNNDQHALYVLPTMSSMMLFEEMPIEEIETVDYSVNTALYSPEIIDLNESSFVYHTVEEDFLSTIDLSSYAYL